VAILAETNLALHKILINLGSVMAVYSSCSTRLRAEQSLVRWATPQLHDIDALAKMVDPALRGIYPAKSLSRFADIIALCVQVNLGMILNSGCLFLGPWLC
jgi:hypothetical protein